MRRDPQAASALAEPKSGGDMIRGERCPACAGSGHATESDVLGAAYRLRGVEPRRPSRRRLSEERRRELANKMVSHGMPTDVAAATFRVAPKVVA